MRPILAILIAAAAPAAGPHVAAGDLPPAAEPSRWHTVVLHHTATEAGSVASIDRVHSQRLDADGNPWLGIGYHFLIGNGQGMPDGSAEPTFRWERQIDGAHAGNATLNGGSIGVALVGNFESHPPTAKQLETLVGLLKRLDADFGFEPADVVAHRDVRATLCPGRHFPLETARRAVAALDAARPAAFEPETTAFDPATTFASTIPGPEAIR